MYLWAVICNQSLPYVSFIVAEIHNCLNLGPRQQEAIPCNRSTDPHRHCQEDSANSASSVQADDCRGHRQPRCYFRTGPTIQNEELHCGHLPVLHSGQLTLHDFCLPTQPNFPNRVHYCRVWHLPQCQQIAYCSLFNCFE